MKWELSLGTKWKAILWNVVFSMLISWTGGLGILITRIAKGKWSNVTWSYIPVFWIPVLFSWPVAIAALVGMFDK